MELKHIIMTTAIAITTLVIGFGAGLYVSNRIEKEAALNKTDAAVSDIVRIRDSVVEWYDGEAWEAVGTVEELQQKDVYFLAQEKLAAFEERYIVARAAEVATDAEVKKETEDPILSGKKETPKKPSSSSAATSGSQAGSGTGTTAGGVYVAPPVYVAPTPTTPTPTPTPEVTPTPTPTPDPTPTPPPASGDGEDMGWSDDYL